VGAETNFQRLAPAFYANLGGRDEDATEQHEFVFQRLEARWIMRYLRYAFKAYPETKLDFSRSL
jgi:hypothetical protein